MALIKEQLKKPKVIAAAAAAFLATGVTWGNCIRQDAQQSSCNPSVPGISEPSKTPSLHDENYFKPPSKPSKKGTGAKSEIQKQWAQFSDQKVPR